MISKVLFQLREMMKFAQHKVEHSYHRNMSTTLKLILKCQVAFMLTDNVHFVKIRYELAKLQRFKNHISESQI